MDGHTPSTLLLEGIATLLGAQAAVFVEDEQFVVTGAGMMTAFEGLNVEPLRGSVDAIVAARIANPHFREFLRRPVPNSGVLALTRSECIPDKEWEREEFYQRYLRPVGIRDTLLSVHALDRPGHVIGCNLLREEGSRAFDAEDRSLLQLFSAHASDLMLPRSLPDRWGLTPREREVFTRLLAGDSNKEIALAIGCGVRTVEVHVTRVLAKAGVTTRARLVAASKFNVVPR